MSNIVTVTLSSIGGNNTTLGDTTNNFISLDTNINASIFNKGIPKFVKLTEFNCTSILTADLTDLIEAGNNNFIITALPLIAENIENITLANVANGTSNTDLASAIQTTLNVLIFDPACTFTVTWNSGTGKFTIAGSRAFYILWNYTSFNPARLLGFIETDTYGDGTLTSFTSDISVPEYTSYTLSSMESYLLLRSPTLSSTYYNLDNMALNGIGNVTPHVIGLIPISQLSSYTASDDEPYINIVNSTFYNTLSNYYKTNANLYTSNIELSFTLKLASGMGLKDLYTKFWYAKLAFSTKNI